VPACVIDAHDLIKRILDINPESRFTVEKIRRHPWYTQIHIEPPTFDVNGSNGPLDEVSHQLDMGVRAGF